MTRSVTLPDGRELAYEEYGLPGGVPVLSFHGGLSSRLDAAPAHEAALALGIWLISPDRPGMGRSTFQTGRRLLDWPDDVAALTAALGIDEFAVMGWSCGGPYAAVCGARMAERVTAVGLLSSAVPFELVGSTKGLARDDRILLLLVRWAPWLASALLRVSIGDATETRLYREIRRTFPAVDRAALEERGSIDDAVAFVKESMRQGSAGCLQDYRVFGAPWGFDLSEVTAPVDIWEGGEDHTGPPEYRDLLLRHLPGAQLSVVPGEGHLSLLQHQAPAILGRLVDQRPR
jgi:pimeloyl-ACP methyl ester carboxylesterase